MNSPQSKRTNSPQNAMLSAAAAALNLSRAMADMRVNIADLIAPSTLGLHLVSSQILESMQTHQKLSRQMAEAVRPYTVMSQEIANLFRPILEQNRTISENISGVANALSVALGNTQRLAEINSNLMQSPGLQYGAILNAQLTDLASLFAGTTINLPAIEAADLARIIADELTTSFAESYGGTEVIEPLDTAEVIVNTAAHVEKRITRFQISSDTLVQIIIAIVLAWISLQSSQADMREINSRLDRLIELQEQRTGSQQEANTPYYVVLRPVRLRGEPNSSAQVLKFVAQNQVLKSERQEGQWLYVTFYDDETGAPRSGWVFKRYLRLFSERSPEMWSLLSQ